MYRKPSIWLLILLAAALALAGCGQASAPEASSNSTDAGAASESAAAAPQAPRTLTAQVGAGQDTTAVNAFMPASLYIRAGDTVTWKLDSDEIHTVTFLGGQAPPPFEVPVPGGSPEEVMISPEVAFPTRLPGAPVEHYAGASYANSGIMSKAPGGPDAPPNDSFSLTFDEPGVYPFICLLHPYQRGVVVVAEATATDVPSQADIDAQIQAEQQGFLAQVEAAVGAGSSPRGETLADGSQLWYVEAGSSVGDPSAQTFEFLSKDLTINAGDTVVWTSHEFHTITFIPAPPAPEFVVPVLQEAGPPFLTLNGQVAAPAKPSPTYDPAQFYNSGLLGPGLPGGSSWSLTFDQPGTYEYFCAVHRELGMKGRIVVKEG